MFGAFFFHAKSVPQTKKSNDLCDSPPHEVKIVIWVYNCFTNIKNKLSEKSNCVDLLETNKRKRRITNGQILTRKMFQYKNKFDNFTNKNERMTKINQ